MEREEKLEMIYRRMPANHKGRYAQGRKRAILIKRAGEHVLTALDTLTDEEITRLLPESNS